MKIVGLLSWYDEPTDWLADCIARIAPYVDSLVAVDGAYAHFPGAREKPCSPPEQAVALSAAAAEVGLPVYIHGRPDPWPSEIVKRDEMFRLAELLAPDWFFRIDADEFAETLPADFRGRLSRTARNVAEVTLWDADIDYVTPLRVLFRAVPGITISHAHQLVSYPAPDGERRFLSGDSGRHLLEPAEQLLDVRLEHRRFRRPIQRQQAKATYYQALPHIETAMPPKPTGGPVVKVRMKEQLTGSRNGIRWPRVGEVLEVLDAEAVDLINGGSAVAVVDDPPKSEKRPAPTKRTETRKA